MSDVLASVSVVLGAEISGFRAAMAEARKELRGLVQFSEGLKDIGTGLTQYVSGPLALLGGVSLAASAKLESLKNGLAAIAQQDLAKQGVTGLFAMQQAAADAGERVAALQVIAKAPGLGLETAEQADIRLRAVGTSAQQSAKEIKSFANAIATTGGGRTQFETVTTQLSQLTAKGKVLAQDLRPIIEAAPAVAAALQRLYGTVDSETISASLAKQGKNSADFVATLTDELAKLPQVTGGLKAIYENDLDALLVTGAKFGDGIAEAFNLKVVGQRFGDFVTRLGDGFANLSPGIKTLVVALGGIAVAVGPVLVAVGTLGAALPAITAGFEVLGVSSLAALGPVLPVAAGVAAAAYLIYQNWDALTAYFSSGEGSTLFGDLARAASSAAEAIGEAFSTLRANAGGNLGEVVSAANLFRSAFRELAVGVTAGLDIISGTIQGLTGLFTGDFASAADGAARALDGLVAPLANLFGFSKRAPTDSGIYVLSQQAKEFNAVGPEFAANLALLNSVRLDVVAQQAAEAAKRIGLLADLEARLKEAKEAKPNLSTEAEIAASNQLITSLEAQIKRLNELGIASKEMQKAYADVQKSLRTVANESLALGDQYNYLQNRQSATESGIKKLIGAGFSPASTAVQKLVADLRNLNNTLGDNALLSGRTVKGSEKLFETPDFKINTPEAVKAPEVLLPDYKAIFGTAALDISKGSGGIQEAFTTFTQAQADFNTNTAQLIDAFPLAGFIAIGEGIGSALASGADVLEAAGKAILGALGDFLAKYGAQIVLKGLGDIAIGNYIQGGLEIAAGTALIAGGTAAKSVAGSSTSPSSSSPTIGGRGSGGNYGQASTQQTIKIEVGEMKLRGPDLVAVFKADGYRVNRVS